MASKVQYEHEGGHNYYKAGVADCLEYRDEHGISKGAPSKILGHFIDDRLGAGLKVGRIHISKKTDK